jgi:Na+/H+ antiporter NhaD/arsenite permease-like protein
MGISISTLGTIALIITVSSPMTHPHVAASLLPRARRPTDLCLARRESRAAVTLSAPPSAAEVDMNDSSPSGHGRNEARIEQRPVALPGPRPGAGARSGSPRALGIGMVAVVGAVVGYLVVHSLAVPHHDEQPEEILLGPDGAAPALWALGVLPFVGILGAIAILPLLHFSQHWWESNTSRLTVSLACALLTVIYVLIAAGGGLVGVRLMLEHAIVLEYIPFMTLLFALYVISGGINLEGDLPAHPLTNTAFLAAGAVIASVVGTTGASMLLIRPLLQTNAERRHVTHTVVFFIFLVSNVGGCLLPIGDPPLFLGYLRGVPFFWTLVLWKEWAFCCAALLATYYTLDTIAYRREPVSAVQRDELMRRPLRLRGGGNLVLLAGIVISVALVNPHLPLPGTSWRPFPFLRELLLLALVAASLLLTRREVREANRFSYHAIVEVAALFIGIFVTMQVPIAVLRAGGGALGLEAPWHYFWATGLLSSVLDNAPTYVVLLETAAASFSQAGGEPGAGTVALLSGNHVPGPTLVAISLGAVFMGAMTYIGNGPNFMVKSIAEQAGVPMPTFFGFLFRYSVPILIPLFIACTLVFLGRA